MDGEKLYDIAYYVRFSSFFAIECCLKPTKIISLFPVTLICYSCVCFSEYFRDPNLFLYFSEILPFFILNFKSFQYKQFKESVKGNFYYRVLYFSN